MTIEDKLDSLIAEQQRSNELLSALVTGNKAKTLEGVTPEKEKKETVAAKKKRLAKEAADKAAAEVDDFGMGDDLEPTNSAPTMTLDDVEDELRTLVKNKKGQQGKEILGKYGYKKLPEIQEEHLNEIYADLKAANSV